MNLCPVRVELERRSELEFIMRMCALFKFEFRKKIRGPKIRRVTVIRKGLGPFHVKIPFLHDQQWHDSKKN